MAPWQFLRSSVRQFCNVKQLVYQIQQSVFVPCNSVQVVGYYIGVLDVF